MSCGKLTRFWGLALANVKGMAVAILKPDALANALAVGSAPGDPSCYTLAPPAGAAAGERLHTEQAGELDAHQDSHASSWRCTCAGAALLMTSNGSLISCAGALGITQCALLPVLNSKA